MNMRDRALLRVLSAGSGGGGDTPSANIQPLEVTENGTYTAEGGVTGFSPVMVNVGGDTDIYKTQLIGLIDGTATEITVPDGVTKVRDSAFYGCPILTTADFPAATSVGSYAFYSCPILTTADFPAATSVGKYAFCACSKLTALILRNTAGVCTLSNTNAFSSTPIDSRKGYIYVPSALVDSYKAATNWSNYAAQFRALEDYTVDGTTTGELDPTKI